MPPPPKARLHNRTGKLKNINKSNNNSPRNNVNTSQSGPIASTSASTSTETGSPSSAESNIQQFELELCWCIQTLEKTLESPTISAKVAQDTEKTLKTLKSNTQPMIKKRQLMKSAFGDYRAKMQEEERRLGLGKRAIQFVENDTKSSKESSKNSNKSYFVKKSLSTALGKGQFEFNFPVNEIEKLKIENSEDANNAIENNSNDKGNSNIQTNASETEITSSNKYKTADNSFRFNFPVE